MSEVALKRINGHGYQYEPCTKYTWYPPPRPHLRSLSRLDNLFWIANQQMKELGDNKRMPNQLMLVI